MIEPAIIAALFSVFATFIAHDASLFNTWRDRVWSWSVSYPYLNKLVTCRFCLSTHFAWVGLLTYWLLGHSVPAPVFTWMVSSGICYLAVLPFDTLLDN